VTIKTFKLLIDMGGKMESHGLKAHGNGYN